MWIDSCDNTSVWNLSGTIKTRTGWNPRNTSPVGASGLGCWLLGRVLWKMVSLTLVNVQHDTARFGFLLSVTWDRLGAVWQLHRTRISVRQLMICRLAVPAAPSWLVSYRRKNFDPLYVPRSDATDHARTVDRSPFARPGGGHRMGAQTSTPLRTVCYHECHIVALSRSHSIVQSLLLSHVV